MTARLLALQGVCAGYGALRVVWDVTLEVAAGKWAVLVGASGAGKTTLVRTIAGLITLQSGSVCFDGRNISNMPAHRRVHAGLAMIPEGRRLFGGMTVAENLMLGGFAEPSAADRAQRLAQIYQLFPILAMRRKQVAATLSGGEQQMCAIGRALMLNPRLLIIDELSFGLAPTVVDQIIEALISVRQRGTALFVIDQDVTIGLGLADQAYVMRSGRIVMQGDGDRVLRAPGLHREYIGS
jgi:branched-chain amino acid transport system ATP-binding protein